LIWSVCFVTSGANVNQVDQDGRTTATMLTFFHSHIDVIHALLDYGADIDYHKRNVHNCIDRVDVATALMNRGAIM
jgi:ankyrin repeat protein